MFRQSVICKCSKLSAASFEKKSDLNSQLWSSCFIAGFLKMTTQDAHRKQISCSDNITNCHDDWPRYRVYKGNGKTTLCSLVYLPVQGRSLFCTYTGIRSSQINNTEGTERNAVVIIWLCWLIHLELSVAYLIWIQSTVKIDLFLVSLKILPLV